jgi:hypothetical protein
LGMSRCAGEHAPDSDGGRDAAQSIEHDLSPVDCRDDEALQAIRSTC